MLRHPVVLSSLQEDFSLLGIRPPVALVEDAARYTRQTSLELEAAPDEDEEMEITDEPGENEDEEEVYEETGDEAGDEVDENLSSMARGISGKVQAIGQLQTERRGTAARMIKRRRVSPSAAQDTRAYYQHHKSAILARGKHYRSSSHGAQVIRKHNNILNQRFGGGAAKPSNMVLHTAGMDRLSNLAEEIRSIVKETKAGQSNLAMRSFAETALVADLLSRAFKYYGESLEDESLLNLSLQYDQLANESADVAEGLTESEYDAASLEEAFREHMDVLLDGLDVYEDICDFVEAVDLSEKNLSANPKPGARSDEHPDAGKKPINPMQSKAGRPGYRALSNPAPGRGEKREEAPGADRTLSPAQKAAAGKRRIDPDAAKSGKPGHRSLAPVAPGRAFGGKQAPPFQKGGR